jgi:hypothetical protein
MACRLLLAGYSLGTLLNPEDGSSTFLRNAELLLDYTAHFQKTIFFIRLAILFTGLLVAITT